jgi:hypothetical protein
MHERSSLSPSLFIHPSLLASHTNSLTPPPPLPPSHTLSEGDLIENIDVQSGSGSSAGQDRPQRHHPRAADATHQYVRSLASSSSSSSSSRAAKGGRRDLKFRQ